MPNLLILFNHTLTEPQIKDAHVSIGVTRIIDPPEPVRRCWAMIPPESASLHEYLEPVRQWIIENETSGDLVLIQGEFGATWIMVNFAFSRGLIPIYSTTRRKAVEERVINGTVRIIHTFEHFRYRRYEQIG